MFSIYCREKSPPSYGNRRKIDRVPYGNQQKFTASGRKIKGRGTLVCIHSDIWWKWPGFFASQIKVLEAFTISSTFMSIDIDSLLVQVMFHIFFTFAEFWFSAAVQNFHSTCILLIFIIQNEHRHEHKVFSACIYTLLILVVLDLCRLRLTWLKLD